MLLEVLIPTLVPVSASARERTCSLAAVTALGRMLSGALQVRSGKQSSERGRLSSVPKRLTLRSTLQCKATWPIFTSFTAPICSDPLAQTFSICPVTQTGMSLAFNTTHYMELSSQTAQCSSSKPLQADRCGLDGFLVFKRPQELQGGCEVCRPKASCGLLALQPPGDVVFKSILPSQ